jgi:hypothetical protein
MIVEGRCPLGVVVHSTRARFRMPLWQVEPEMVRPGPRVKEARSPQRLVYLGRGYHAASRVQDPSIRPHGVPTRVPRRGAALGLAIAGPQLAVVAPCRIPGDASP